MTTSVIQTGQVVKIEPIFILPLHLTFIGKVVYPRLWNTTIDQSKGYKDYEYTALQDTSYFSGDHIIHYLVGAEFKPNGPVIPVAPLHPEAKGYPNTA